MRYSMRQILWIENTDASSRELSTALGKKVTLLKSIEDIRKFSWKQKFDAVVIDDLLDDIEQIFDALEKRAGKTPVLVLTDKKRPIKPLETMVLCVGAPFDIPEIQKTLHKLEAKNKA